MNVAVEPALTVVAFGCDVIVNADAEATNNALANTNKNLAIPRIVPDFSETGAFAKALIRVIRPLTPRRNACFAPAHVCATFR